MKILIVPGTNFELYYLSSIVYALSQKDGSLEFNLFLPKTVENNLTPELKNIYSKTDFFETPALTPKISLNPVKMIFNIFDNLSQYWKFKEAAQKALSGVDMVCIPGIKEFFANVLCRISPKNVRLIAVRTANEKIDQTTDFKKRPFLSFLLNIKNFLFGCSLMEYKWRAGRKFSIKKLVSNIDNDLISKNFSKYPYHRTISIADYDIGKTGEGFFRLPPVLIFLKKIYEVENENPSILLAGDQTPLYSSWDEEDQNNYEKVFDYLRDNFKNFKLLFKPKKGKTDMSRYNLEGFEILDSNMSLEEICLRKNIKKVISIRSSSSKFASCLGISGYLLYPLFKLPKDLREVVENEHYDIQSTIRVKKLEDLNKNSDSPSKKYEFDDLGSLYWEAIIR